jgi:transcriptional regulator with XRE-family HTH domain
MPADYLSDFHRCVGDNIRSRRKGLRLTLADLSRLSGVAVPALSHIENGTRDFKLSTMIRLAEALRVDAASLLVVNTPPTAAPAVPLSEGYDLDGG